ncbi:MAG: hypothetical protein HDQ91_05510 [Desulfovibrio sp.]|nr:hypothetical protein [Desulfovibrio sp.]
MDKFLRKEEIAELFGCGHKKACAILKKLGVASVDLGRGRNGGPRWLESAVHAAMLKMHSQAQAAAQPARRKPIATIGMAGMNVNQLAAYLDNAKPVQ